MVTRTPGQTRGAAGRKDPFKEINVLNSLKRWLVLSCLVAVLGLSFGCNISQPTKNVWKGTKGLWDEYVSPPAEIDYEQKGELTDTSQSMVTGMMRIDIELTRLERAMINADRPPTRGWLNEFFTSFTWIDGFAGIKNDGTVLGVETYPGRPEKELDYNRILHEDPKQNTRALRCDVVMSEYGPEVIVATPLYDGVDFLGCVATIFDMSELAAVAGSPRDVIILTPYGLLWPGRFDYGATPLVDVDWETVATKRTQGSVDNKTGTFAYQIRYLGNLPIIFAVVEEGDFPEGASALEQTRKYMKKRDKIGPPEVAPRTRVASGTNAFGAPEEPSDGLPTDEEIEAEQQRMMEAQRQRQAAMMQQERARRQQAAQMQEARRIEQERRAIMIEQQRQAMEEAEKAEPAPTVTRPSPFGPRGGASVTPSPAPAAEPETAAESASESAAKTPSATLPGGRPSPFGPREAAPAKAEEARPEAAQPVQQPVRRSRPSPFGPSASSETPPAATTAPAAEKAAEATGKAAESTEAPARLPSGRPSPFGPATE